MKKIFIFILLITNSIIHAQSQPDVVNKFWQGQWIAVPNTSSNGYGVYMFRKSAQLTAKPNKYFIHVSADNRYKLFVNEKLVSIGPARGDIAHWNYETIDIASYLQTGKNTIASIVWNEGDFKPEAQITHKTAFILQGATNSESAFNTNNTWLCEVDKSFAPLKFSPNTYYVAGAGEIRDMALHSKNWRETTFDDSKWQKAKFVDVGAPKNIIGAYGTMSGWMLVPSGIPQMEMSDERLKKVVLNNGGVTLTQGFPQQKVDQLIPTNSTQTIILDQTYLTNAYPNLTFSGGKGATISLSYAEAMFTAFPAKGNRDETEGKIFIGRMDSIISDGSVNQKFISLTYRTYRYLQMRITTQSEPLTINDVYGTFTGYPFEMKARLTNDNPEYGKMLDIGWRTARLCAAETYMDCPYYEQLQYIGDGRIQALVSLYNSGDDRLVKNAINLMDWSRTPEGVTLSRHPSYTPQYIPTFSLWYIGMLQDYARYGSDMNFVKSKMGGVRQILDYFKSYQQADGSLKNVPQWMFTDWVDNQKDWVAGRGPMSANGSSAMLDLQLLLAYQVAADLESQLGFPAMATTHQTTIATMKKTIRAKYWDSTKKVFSDREEKDLFSQHTNALAILTGAATTQEIGNIAKELLTNKQMAPASIYFKYYLHQALIKAGLGNDYMNWLDKWRENIQQGLTTWAETSDVNKTRSDCHAWGSSPNVEFYRTTLGIDSDGLGFSKVKIEPHLGNITKISGEIPHPKGIVGVSYALEKNKWKIIVNLPSTVTGNLIWKGKKIAIKGGENKFDL